MLIVNNYYVLMIVLSLDLDYKMFEWYLFMPLSSYVRKFQSIIIIKELKDSIFKVRSSQMFNSKLLHFKVKYLRFTNFNAQKKFFEVSYFEYLME